MVDYYSEENIPIYDKIPPFRFVQSYEHCYKTRAKGRWVKKTLLDAMEEEFRAYDRNYYEQAITKGKILVNQKSVVPGYIIKSGDLIEHFALRTEPPVLDIPIKIVFEDENFCVVNKPPSMIVHTGGGYHYNTLMGILFYEHGKRGLYTLHRLDRLTSGLILFSKQKELAQQFHDANSKLTVNKTYYARVQGNFPEDIKQSTRQQYCVSMKDAIFSCCSDEDAERLQAKQAITLFTKLWYDEQTDSSLLLCKPVTGKTHQIRVHLKDLGYPILNDIGYGGRNIQNHILYLHFENLDFKKINVKIREYNKQPKEEENNNENNQPPIKKKIKTNEGQGHDVQPQEQSKQSQQDGFKIFEWDYETHPLEIYLHSFEYQFGDKIFKTDPPYWAEKKLPQSFQEQ